MMKKLRCGSLFDGIVRVYEFVRERRGFDPRPRKKTKGPREVFEECYREINPEEVEFVKAGPDGKISEVEMEEWI